MMGINRWIALLAVIAVTPAAAGQLQLNPIKDNTLIYSADGSTSHGAGQHFFAGRTGQGSPTDLRRGLLAFDVSAIPSRATIGSVTLRLYLDRSSDFADRNVTLHRVLQDWGEGLSDGGATETGAGGGRGAAATNNDATWKYRFYNAANPTASPVWTTEGGDFVAAASATSSIGNTQYEAAGYNWTGAGLVSDVQNWVNGTANYGWIVIGDETTSATARRFESRNNANNGTGSFPDYRPRLMVWFAIPGDFDGDNDVDGADFVAWQTHFPKSTGATPPEGDADFDGDVDGADFVVWQTNFPYSPGPAAAPVPEPGAWLMAMLWLPAVARAMQCRRRVH
jgi:hypothetical protein